MEMHVAQIIALLITGLGVGFASGLLGVGGCFIMIPVQFWVLKSIGVDPTIAIRIAFGTNLLVVLPTAFSGAMTHHKKGAVVWKAGITLGITGAIGAFFGGFIAAHLPGKILNIAFGIAVVLGALRMLTARPPQITEEPSDSLAAFILWGIPLGIVSGIIGIGGGVLMIPIMVYFLRFKMHQAVGTSTALMIFTAVGGSLSFLINGLGVQGLPPYSTGYLNWLQWILLAGCSIPMAIVGAKTAHLLPAKQLKYIFIAVMFYMGLKMIGVFAWFHLPI
ncbi:MAG: sulfite exporter TauE/SafE family protein [Deltaproteobacteria bacterium]|nr:sulfite exporter TauE/SafE family protein [Deltaproteobacteria bacterium]MBW2016304.1 sulfite exporter TauE/SafE family protein [Deltaproteobacteria bacterium]MBW2128888.1 sulfite exporter TauE/SafE family protein [Deltaproteobacteria bacterium]MBW2303849.1 sulfite exporter TauE/SafE family protein [Deltaproteobacteria bacterium]